MLRGAPNLLGEALGCLLTALRSLLLQLPGSVSGSRRRVDIHDRSRTANHRKGVQSMALWCVGKALDGSTERVLLCRIRKPGANPLDGEFAAASCAQI